MNELSPEDKKTLKLFSYYIQSLSNSKKATITYELYDGYGVDYIGNWYTNTGKEIDGYEKINSDRKSTRLNSSHSQQSRMPSSA